VGEYSRQEAAGRAGVGTDDLDRLVELGILTPDDGAQFSAGDVRRIELVQSFVAAGIPLEGLAADLRQGGISLAWLDSPTYNRFAQFSSVTFEGLAARTGVRLGARLPPWMTERGSRCGGAQAATR
jgi:hypothetical protein